MIANIGKTIFTIKAWFLVKIYVIIGISKIIITITSQGLCLALDR